MSELLPLAIGVGLAVGMLSTELLGLAPGGMVVPGYIALHLARPGEIAVTLAAAVATFAIVRALSSVIIVYGRRRTVLMILVGYLLGMAFRRLALPGGLFPDQALTVIGYIIPGLIAIWLDRQGVLETLTALLGASVVVRLVLVLLVGTELLS